MLRFQVPHYLCIIVISYTLSRKSYRYTFISSLVFCYYLLESFRSDYNFHEMSSIFGHLQRLMLLVLAIYSFFVAIKSSNRKTDIKMAVFSCIACVFRIAHSVVFRVYGNLMKSPGADIPVLSNQMVLICDFIDLITELSLLIMIFIIWRYCIRKMETKN